MDPRRNKTAVLERREGLPRHWAQAAPLSVAAETVRAVRASEESDPLNRLAKILKWTAIAVVAAVVIVYAGDYLSIRYRMAHSAAKPPFAVLKFRPIYAIPHKDGKDEFDFGDAETETCVHSLFPHSGYRPCWYANKEVQKPIVMDGR